jgi:hypothetical protein
VLLSPEGTSYPYYACSAGSQARRKRESARRHDAVETREPARSSRKPSRHAAMGQRPGPDFTRTIAVDDRYMFTVTRHGERQDRRAVTLYPYAYVARDGVPAEKGITGAARRLRRRRGRQRATTPATTTSRTTSRRKRSIDRRLGRHHRQILDGGRHSAAEPGFDGAYRASSLNSRRPTRPITASTDAHRAGRERAP